METFGVRNIVFSSSATVYGETDELPVTETTAFKKSLSAYGSTKQMGENILEKVAATGSIHSISILAVIVAPFMGIDKKGGFQYIQEYIGEYRFCIAWSICYVFAWVFLKKSYIIFI